MNEDTTYMDDQKAAVMNDHVDGGGIRISVIVPVYNGEKYLKEMLDSIICQKNDETEIILINDGSSDHSEEICLDYQKRYGKDFIKYYHKENGGVCSARNLGLEKASGRFITFADDDDWWEDNAFEVMLSEIRKEDFDMMIFEPYLSVSRNQRSRLKMPAEDRVWRGKEMFDVVIKPTALGIKNASGEYFNMGLWNCLFSAHLLRKYQLKLDPYLRMGEDLVFISQAMGKCHSIKTLPQPLYNWRVNPESVTHSYVKSSDLSITKSIYIYDRIGEALSDYPREEYAQDIAPKYAAFVVSFARNWTDRRSGESFGNTYKKLKEICAHPVLADYIAQMDLKRMHGRKKLEMTMVRNGNMRLLIIYCSLLHLILGIKRAA